jgi:hypothetical protein
MPRAHSYGTLPRTREENECANVEMKEEMLLHSLIKLLDNYGKSCFRAASRQTRPSPLNQGQSGQSVATGLRTHM